jgi:hypothetical protein
VVATPLPAPDARAIVYDASGEIPPGAARVIVIARTAVPGRAVATAPALGDPHGPLASRLAALEAPAQVRSVVATAHPDGGCLAATMDLSDRDLAADVPARVATAAALARQEIAVEMTDAPPSPDLGRSLAMRAADPRDAAEAAAWWLLAGRAPGADDSELRVSLIVGIAAGRDTSEPTTVASADAVRAEIDRAGLAWHAPVVEPRVHVERGQGEVWVLLASTCGTLGETNGDAGAGAAVATAAAARAAATDEDIHVEPFVALDGLGVLVHGPARPGESPQAHGRRLADTAARAFAADALAPIYVEQARTALLARSTETTERALGALAVALDPGHPSWIDPTGTTFGLASASDSAIAMRASAMRDGPLRVAVLANVDPGQANAAARAVDRWVARHPGEARACPPAPTAAPPRPGTYAVDLPAGAPSEALIAIPLTPGDESLRAPATWLAAALDGPHGLLARGLGGGGDPSQAPLARAWSASVIGWPRTPAMVVRVSASDGTLDAAVAQTRVLLDRLRQGAVSEDDRSRAASLLAQARLAKTLDPRARSIDLWRSEAAVPDCPLESLRSFAAATLRDDALVIVAARPPRIDPSVHPSVTRESRGRSRE